VLLTFQFAFHIVDRAAELQAAWKRKVAA